MRVARELSWSKREGGSRAGLNTSWPFSPVRARPAGLGGAPLLQRWMHSGLAAGQVSGVSLSGSVQGGTRQPAGNLSCLSCYPYRLPPPRLDLMPPQSPSGEMETLHSFRTRFIFSDQSRFTRCLQCLGVLPASFFLPRILNVQTFNPSNTTLPKLTTPI